MFVIWVITCMVAVVLAELLLGSYGIILPAFAAGAFYFMVIGRWRLGVPFLLIMGTILDLALGRRVPVQGIVVPLLIPLALSWRRHGDCIHLGAQVIPGVIVGALSGALTLLLVRLPGAGVDWHNAWRNGWLLVQYLAGGAVCVPLLCRVLDRLAARLDFPRFDAVQKMLG